MNKNKRFTFIFITLLVFSISFLSTGAATHSWYIKRNKDHKQPICETQFRFIENYGGYYVDKKHGDDNGDKVLYLTFDAGYENGNIEKTLDVLKEENVPGAFFVLSNLILKNPDLIKRMTNEGHIVANHTSRHPDMTKFTNVEDFSIELSKLERVYRECTGLEMPKYFRPPMGSFNEDTLKFAHQLGYKTIFWSFAYADWDNERQPDPDYALKLILDNVHNGAVILLHPTSATNAGIMKNFILALKEQGYRFGTLDELTS